ncbi:MAG: hypothetical protein VYC91_01350 [Acidobacteriota bacterium]|nr:hypothetical protein [Acidobacteriota bacterium]
MKKILTTATSATTTTATQGIRIGLGQGGQLLQGLRRISRVLGDLQKGDGMN